MLGAETSGFDSVVESIVNRRHHSDPRAARLSSVTSAIVDVIHREKIEATAPRVIARAVVTLEGTLRSMHQDDTQLVDSFYSQRALLELIQAAVPFLGESTTAATLLPIGRSLRTLLELTMSVMSERSDLCARDGVSCVSGTLCELSRCSQSLLGHASKYPRTIDDETIKTIFRGTLMRLLDCDIERVRVTAGNCVLQLLRMEAPKCHNAVLVVFHDTVCSSLDSLLRVDDPSQRCIELQGRLVFLRLVAEYLNNQSREKLMLVLVKLIKINSAIDGDFILKPKASSAIFAGLHAIFPVVLDIVNLNDRVEETGKFSSRVLATVLQVQPAAVIQGANERTVISCLDFLARIILSAAKRLVHEDPKDAAFLLPLTTVYVQQLVTELNKHSDNVSPISGQWFGDLFALFKTDLREMSLLNSQDFSKCCSTCCERMLPILRSKHLWARPNSLVCLVELLLLSLDQESDSFAGCLREIVSLGMEVDAASPESSAVKQALLRLIQGLGIEKFWVTADMESIILERKGQSLWLIETMRQSGSPDVGVITRLAFFNDHVLPLARRIDLVAAESSNPLSLRILGVELWSLFSNFCSRPIDVESSMPRLAPILVRAMRNTQHPQIMVSICCGIDCLAQGFLNSISEVDDLHRNEFPESCSGLEIMGVLAEKILPTMFKLVDDLHRQDEAPIVSSDVNGNGLFTGDSNSSQVVALASAISSLAKLAPSELVQKQLFAKVIHRLLEASQSEVDLSDKMCALLTLSQALYSSGSLNDANVILLYRALRPVIATDETNPKVQKRAYKLLAEVCGAEAFVLGCGRLKDLVELLESSASTVHINARSARLHCLILITRRLGGSLDLEKWVTASLLGEVILCLKDSKNRTRDLATKLLISLPTAGIDVLVLLTGATAAMASETPYMRSAAIFALTILLKEYGGSTESVQAQIPSLVQTVLLVAADPSREVTKNVIGFLRVAMAVCPMEITKPLLPSVLATVLKDHKGNERFRCKIKLLLRKLVRIFGHDSIESSSSGIESSLLQSCKDSWEDIGAAKQIKHRWREINSQSEEEDSKVEPSRSRLSLPSGESLKQRPNKRVGKVFSGDGSSVMVRNDAEGVISDLWERSGWKLPSTDFDSSSSEEVSISFDDDGRLVVNDKIDEAIPKNTGKVATKTPIQLSKRKNSPQKNQERRDTKKLGDPYKSNKAGGDVKRKGQKFDPYAFVPLDGRSYTKKNRRSAIDQLDTVVRGRKRQKR